MVRRGPREDSIPQGRASSIVNVWPPRQVGVSRSRQVRDSTSRNRDYEHQTAAAPMSPLSLVYMLASKHLLPCFIPTLSPEYVM